MSETAEDLNIIELSNRERSLAKYRVLELNADGQPMSYWPLSTMTWQEIMFLVVKGETTGEKRINILEEYDEEDAVIRTAFREFKLPSVVSHLKFIPRAKCVPFTKYNVFLRDDFTCQYTGERHKPEDLTWDHVVAQSQGGRTDWMNIVTAHRDINQRKDSMTLKEFRRLTGLYLLKQPHEPTTYELQNKGRKYPPKYLHDSWADYLYWDSEIEG